MKNKITKNMKIEDIFKILNINNYIYSVNKLEKSDEFKYLIKGVRKEKGFENNFYFSSSAYCNDIKSGFVNAVNCFEENYNEFLKTGKYL